MVREMIMSGEVYAIVGPTASGKTETSLFVAEEIGAEIISVDSRQVYRFMDIGTDKATPAMRARVPHHLIDVVDPDETYTAADFTRDAMEAAEDIRSRGMIPLLVGGTPMYYRALEGRMLSESLPNDPAVRGEIDALIERDGLASAHAELARCDPSAAAWIHVNDRARITRYLELYKLSGIPATELFAKAQYMGGLKIRYFALDADRHILYKKIEVRIRDEFDHGFEDEVRWLLSRGYSEDLPSLRGLSYKQMISYINGERSREDAILDDVSATKKFSRKQMTWFRRFDPIIWYDVNSQDKKEIALDMIRKIRVLER